MLSKADTHVHTYYSGVSNYKVLRFPESVAKPEDQVDKARKNGMNVLCITDHNVIAGALKAAEYGKRFDDIDVVIGEEITSADGEVLGLWLTEWVPPGLPIEETIDIIHKQGGIAIAPHPFSFYVFCLRDKINDLDLDGIEVINGGHIDDYTNRKAQLAFKENPGKWAPMSSSDGHSTYTVGFNWTEFEGSGEAALKKAILNKTTIPCGEPSPVIAQVRWSIEVVRGAQKMLAKALLGKLPEDSENPLITKMLTISSGKKIGGIIGGIIYIIPPIPFIAAWLGTTWLKKKSGTLLDEFEMKLKGDQ